MTKEQCENLKKWGLPQNINPGSVIYFKTDNTPSVYTGGVIKESYIIDPSFGELVRYAVKIGKKLDVFYLSIDYNYEEEEYEVYYEFKPVSNTVYSKNPHEVIYKLIEKYNEV